MSSASRTDRRRRSCLAAGLAGILLLSACGGGTDDAPDDATPPPAPTATSDDAATTTGPAAPEATDAVTNDATTDDAATTVTTTVTQDTPTETPVAGSPGTAAPGEDDPTGSPEDSDGGEAREGFTDPDATAEQEPAGQIGLVVDAVRLGLHLQYDRVVLDLTGTGEVGWRAEYSDDPRLDGSGFPVSLAGEGTLVVTVRGTGIPPEGSTAYDPGQALYPGGVLENVTEVLRTAPFEGQLSTFIGVEEEAPFRVFRLEAPERLVIDVAHP